MITVRDMYSCDLCDIHPILPYIDYGDIFYHAANKKLLDRLHDRQCKALKICYKLHGIQDENNMH